MDLFGTRSAAAELARLLDSALDGSRPTTPSGTPAAGGTAALADLALRLQAVAPALAATAVPREEFRAALRTRLVAVASVQGIGATAVAAASPVRTAGLEAAVSWSRARRGLGVAVGAMASAVVVAGVGVAGQQSLPGEPFYGVKRAVEGVELRTADGALERGTTHLAHADERLDEVAALTRGRGAVALAPVALAPVGSRPVAGGGTAELVLETLDDRDASVRAAARLLVRASAAGSDPAPLQQLTGFAARQDRALTALLPDLPLVAQERAQQSLALTGEVSGSAIALLLDALPVAGTTPAPLDGAVDSAVDPVPGGPGQPADPGRAADPAQPGAPLAPGASPAPSGASAARPALGSTDGPDGGSPAAERPGTGAEPQPTATPRATPRPALPVPGPVATVVVPLPAPVPTNVPLPLPVPDLPVAPVAPAAPVAPLPPVVVAPTVPALPQVDDVVPAPLKPVTRPLLPGLLVAVPSPAPGAAPSAPVGS